MALRGKTVGGTFPRARARGGGAATADDDARAAAGARASRAGRLRAAGRVRRGAAAPSGLIAARGRGDDDFADGTTRDPRALAGPTYPLPSTLGSKGGKMAWFGSTLASADMVRHNLGEMVHTPAPARTRSGRPRSRWRCAARPSARPSPRWKRARAERGEAAASACFLKRASLPSRALSRFLPRAPAKAPLPDPAGEFRAPAPACTTSRPRRKCRRARVHAACDPHRRSRAAAARIAERDGVGAIARPRSRRVRVERARARAPSLPPSLPLRAASPSPARVV